MVDFLFKIYFSYFLNKGQRGAEGAVNLLTIPLSSNVYLILLYILSFVIRISDLGALGVAIGAIGTAVGIQYFFRSRYIKRKGFEKIIIENLGFYYILGIVFYLLSVIMFPIGLVILLSK